MSVPVNVFAGQQPVNSVLKIRFGAAASLDQGHAGSCVRHKHVTQPVAAVATELKDQLSDIGDDTRSGT